MSEEEKILRYINDEMDPMERSEFQSLIESDDKLYKAVEHSRNIKNALLQDNVDFSQQVRSVIVKNRKSKPSYLWVAASITILLAASIYLLLPENNSAQDLAISYLEPYPDVITSRSEESALNLTLYNKGEYGKAVDYLKEIYASKKEVSVALYLAVSYLHIQEPQEALNVLMETPSESTIYNFDFIWYKSLSYLMLDDAESARKGFVLLKEGSNSYSLKAAEILSDLD